jgi:hypothetical protein
MENIQEPPLNFLTNPETLLIVPCKSVLNGRIIRFMKEAKSLVSKSITSLVVCLDSRCTESCPGVDLGDAFAVYSLEGD